MFNELSKIEFENETRSRRSVLTLSVLLIIFSNLDLQSDTLTILGLEIAISEESIIGTLRLILIIALVAFFFVHLEKLPIRISRFLRKRDEKWWIPHSEEIDQFHASMDPRHEQEKLERENREAHPDWDDELYHQKYVRKQRRLLVQSYYRPIASFTKTFSRVAWPIALAFVALFLPEVAIVLADSPKPLDGKP